MGRKEVKYKPKTTRPKIIELSQLWLKVDFYAPAPKGMMLVFNTEIVGVGYNPITERMGMYPR